MPDIFERAPQTMLSRCDVSISANVFLCSEDNSILLMQQNIYVGFVPVTTRWRSDAHILLLDVTEDERVEIDKQALAWERSVVCSYRDGEA
ncbi:hypothetical protein AVEN_135368-1 [Araneus ventricosus]|uniref:Uncharacterized protein n=1 Tax=Araneus ventricosus TaxID=182803 RepID=A0A4Y2TDW9_ARAVE|nr:hypothetical protein AVEN_131767-1 [Araneus ventricosus]GBN98190.1 hypothetical protein AVEN_135368-1 [Araneus ventricosus]